MSEKFFDSSIALVPTEKYTNEQIALPPVIGDVFLPEHIDSPYFDEEMSECLQMELPSLPELSYLSSAEEGLTCSDVVEKFRKDGTVKRAPFLETQADDEDRDNSLKYIVSDRRVYGASLPDRDSGEEFGIASEQSSIKQLRKFLKIVSSGDTAVGDHAAEMLETISFIGKKEYDEASAGIAAYWMSELDGNADLKIVIMAGVVAASGGYVDYDDSAQVKSDEFLLDNILSFFSDDDIEKYGDRFMIGYDDLDGVDPSNLKVVFLDDWIISGAQLNCATESFIDAHPEFKDSVELHLMIADEQRIKDGLKGISLNGSQISIPIKAYYTAHDSPYGKRCRSHITGFHSSVDYDFEDHIELFLRYLEQEYGYKDLMMPPLTNIVRPYRDEGAVRDDLFPNIKRHQALSSGYMVKTNVG